MEISMLFGHMIEPTTKNSPVPCAIRSTKVTRAGLIEPDDSADAAEDMSAIAAAVSPYNHHHSQKVQSQICELTSTIQRRRAVMRLPLMAGMLTLMVGRNKPQVVYMLDEGGPETRI
jgi:hypothetical protein